MSKVITSDQKISAVKLFCRYNHYHTYPGKKDHNKYIKILSIIEGIDGFILDLVPGTVKDRWNRILKAIDKLSYQEISTIYNLIKGKE